MLLFMQTSEEMYDHIMKVFLKVSQKILEVYKYNFFL